MKRTITELVGAERPEADELLSFVRSSARAALQASERVERASRGYRPNAEYPASDLGGKLKTVARLIDAAGPMFLAGRKVRPGVIGRHPSLTELDQGDLKHHTDFRRVYASLLGHWLGWPSAAAVGSGHAPLRVVAG